MTLSNKFKVLMLSMEGEDLKTWLEANIYFIFNFRSPLIPEIATICNMILYVQIFVTTANESIIKQSLYYLMLD